MERDSDRQVSAPDTSRVGNADGPNHWSLPHDPIEPVTEAASQSQTKSKPRAMLNAFLGAFTGDSGEDKKTSCSRQAQADVINGSIGAESTDHGHQTQPPSTSQPKPVELSDSHGPSATKRQSKSSISTFTNWVSKTVKDTFQSQPSPKHQSEHERDLATGHGRGSHAFECADKIEEDMTTFQVCIRLRTLHLVCAFN